MQLPGHQVADSIPAARTKQRPLFLNIASGLRIASQFLGLQHSGFDAVGSKPLSILAIEVSPEDSKGFWSFDR